jgi:hypothetical protein
VKARKTADALQLCGIGGEIVVSPLPHPAFGEAGHLPNDPDRHSPARTWLDSWIKPGPARDRARRWLTIWLKGDLKDIPEDQAAQFLEEMARDVRVFGADKAVDRFIDKILPKIISNVPPA